MAGFRSIGNIDYLAPDSLDEALRLLQTRGAGARVLNGGTDLVLQMKLGNIRPESVVDVKLIPELNRLEWSRDGGLHIGGAVTLSKLLSFRALPEEYNLLLEACAVIGSGQIKKRGTVGGNLANAAPSADSAPALLCLGARVRLASATGSRTVNLEDFFSGPGRTVLADDELLVEIEVPTPPSPSAGCYLRHTTRAEMDIAVAGVASFLTAAPPDRRIKQARIALGAVAPAPVRAVQTENWLAGRELGPDVVREAAERAAAEASPISDIRASADYRRHLVSVLTRRTLQRTSAELGLVS